MPTIVMSELERKARTLVLELDRAHVALSAYSVTGAGALAEARRADAEEYLQRSFAASDRLRALLVSTGIVL